jgi:AcrR family transcriptional regulator
VELGKRATLLDSILVELEHNGNSESSLDSILSAAGVSKREFEETYGDREGCLLAAYDRLTDGALEKLRTASQGGDDWPSRVRVALSALLDEIAARPYLAAVVTRVVPKLGPRAHARYTGFISACAELVEEGRTHSGVGEELPADVELLAVGAAEELIFHEIDAGRAQQLPQMMPEILFSILAPFIGPERASVEMRLATAAS